MNTRTRQRLSKTSKNFHRMPLQCGCVSCLHEVAKPLDPRSRWAGSQQPPPRPTHFIQLGRNSNLRSPPSLQLRVFSPNPAESSG